MLENRKAGQQPTLLARILRDCRDRSDLTRAQVALRGHMSASLIEKLELNNQTPTARTLKGWFTAVEPHKLYRKKIIALTLSELFPDEMEQAPEHIQLDDHDMQHLDSFPYPACYHTAGVFDITAANDAFYQCFQGLKQLDALVEGAPNLLIWHMRHPSARTAVRDWYDRTHVLLTRFRIQAPGTAPAQRIEEIEAACRQAPEFDVMWKTDPKAELMDASGLTLLDHNSKWQEFTTKTYLCEEPNYLSLLSVVPVRTRAHSPQHD